MFDEQELEEIREALEKWEETTLQQALANMPEHRERFITTSSDPVDRLYTPLDVADMDYVRDLGLPGQYPYTRGIHPTMYRGRPWTMRMFAGFGTAEETNERFSYLLDQGQTGLSIAFDLATLMGYDTDAPEAEGEFGKCGVAVSSLRDMELLLDGIPLDKVSTSMTINSPAPVIWAMYIAAAEKQGVRPEQLRGTLQNDILKEYIAQKEYIFPPEPSMRLVTDTIEYGMQNLPLWNTISISGYHIREAGSTAAQELAFTLADGMEYVRWALERGLDIDDFAPRKALARAGIELDAIGLIELNEAFAVQSLAVMKELGMREEITNVNGGAIALGHPLGCTGARIVSTLLHEMRRRAAKENRPYYGLATLCVGVGQGEATVFEWIGD